MSSIASSNCRPCDAGRNYRFCRLFEDAGYNARLDASAARPRDADLYVYSPGEDFLVEVKSGDKPTGIAAISELAGRLTRTAPFVIGVLISRSRFTKGGA